MSKHFGMANTKKKKSIYHFVKVCYVAEDSWLERKISKFHFCLFCFGLVQILITFSKADFVFKPNGTLKNVFIDNNLNQLFLFQECLFFLWKNRRHAFFWDSLSESGVVDVAGIVDAHKILSIPVTSHVLISATLHCLYKVLKIWIPFVLFRKLAITSYILKQFRNFHEHCNLTHS
jgi:hypothetical protein